MQVISFIYNKGYNVALGVVNLPRSIVNSKYSGQGGYTANSFERYNLPRKVIDQLVITSNASLASSTWSKYQATDRLLSAMEAHYDRQLPFPFSETSTLLFCCYLLTKGYKSETIECHLSSLRNAHLTKGFDPPNLRPVVVQQLLKGNRNLHNLEDSGLGRAAVDVNDLTIIRSNLMKMGLSHHDRVLLWFSMLCMFYGSLRVHEVFPTKKSEYDPKRTLLRRDIKLKRVHVNGTPVEVLILDIKCPKEASGSSVKVELFANGTKSCPVNAYKKLLSFWGHRKHSETPLMTREDKSLWSGKCLNKLLMTLTIGIEKPGGKRILSHSFRAGIPTLMARAGYSDTEIQRQGRWRSSAFLAYCKLGRASRWKDQLSLTKSISLFHIRYMVPIFLTSSIF